MNEYQCIIRKQDPILRLINIVLKYATVIFPMAQ